MTVSRKDAKAPKQYSSNKPLKCYTKSAPSGQVYTTCNKDIKANQPPKKKKAKRRLPPVAHRLPPKKKEEPKKFKIKRKEKPAPKAKAKPNYPAQKVAFTTKSGKKVEFTVKATPKRKPPASHRLPPKV
tara:strand:+ start:346 stop:732 length:387 start_codon:yes stop_codon:yes gene_type:complete